MFPVTSPELTSGFHKQNPSKSHMHVFFFFDSLSTQTALVKSPGHRAPPRKNVSDGGRAKRPRRSDTPEVSVGSPGSPSDALDFGTKLFLTLPEWNITENDIKMIRERGLVPDNLRLDRSRNLDLKIFVEIWQWFPKRRGLLGNRNWWFHPRIVDWFLHPLRKYFVNDAWTFSAPPGHGYIAFWSFWVVWKWTSAMFHQGKTSKYGPRTNSLYSSASRMVMDSLGSNLTVAECCRISRYCKSQIARALNV